MNNYFEKVIGYDYVKEELAMILDVMNNQEKYSKLGAKIPKNVLLHGVPGVGKTLFANEFIKASGRKSYVIRKDKSNGDFVNYIKSTFGEAKRNEPSIILLDDLDKFANGDLQHQNCEEYVTVQSCIDEAREGVTMTEPDDNLKYNIDYYKNKCIIALSGKAAIEIIYGDKDVGCLGDIRNAYINAELIIDDFVAYGFDKFERQKSSNELYVRRESAIYQELEKYYFEAKKILMENREFLDKVADELLKKKILLYTDINKIRGEIKKKV